MKIHARRLALASSVIAAFAFLACTPGTPAAQALPNDVTQVTVLSRPSDGDGGSGDNTPAPPDQGAGGNAAGSTPAAVDAGPSDDVTPADLRAKGPGTYTVPGYIVKIAKCAPCQPGKACKACPPNAVYVSAQMPPAGKPADDMIDLQVPDPSPYSPGGHYRFVVTVAGSSATAAPTRHLFSAQPL